jgi:hypothetical protein
MSEQKMRQVINLYMKRFDLDPISVENSAYPGTPDINFCEGWIECKWVKNYPKKEDTPIIIDHYTPQQKAWIHRRARKGGNVWVMICIGGDWHLLDGLTAFRYLGKITAQELKDLSTWWSNTGLNGGFINAIKVRKI